MSRYGTERNEKLTVTRQERNFHCRVFCDFFFIFVKWFEKMDVIVLHFIK